MLRYRMCVLGSVTRSISWVWRGDWNGVLGLALSVYEVEAKITWGEGRVRQKRLKSGTPRNSVFWSEPGSKDGI